VVFEVTFGPSTSLHLSRAVAYVKAHAEEVLEWLPYFLVRSELSIA
jgi:hypothetical protein